jgi:hypothetical protein
MIRKFLLILFFQPFLGFAQTKDIDSTAVYLLDHMTLTIGSLESCSFKLHTTTDKEHFKYGYIKNSATHEVSMAGPNKMLIQSIGDDFHKGYWYDGNHFSYYSYNENNYSIIDAPENILLTIDSLYSIYDIKFPAADIFYPAFTDDLLEVFDNVKFLGAKEVDGHSCYHILATNAYMSLQIWLSNDSYTLPVKLVFTNKQEPGYPQYEETFYNWQINPNLPTSIFDFIPPPNAKEIYIVPKTELD